MQIPGKRASSLIAAPRCARGLATLKHAACLSIGKVISVPRTDSKGRILLTGRAHGGGEFLRRTGLSVPFE